MTSPEEPQSPEDAADAAAVVLIAGLLTAAGSAGATYGATEVAREAITHALRGLGLSLFSARRLIATDAARPAPPIVPLSPTTRDVAHDGPTHRARYLVKAARRIATAALPGDPTIGDALSAELRYFKQHQTAQTAREQAAQRIDGATNAYGELVGWYSQLDERTTPECVAAHGRNFYPAIPPKIGLPGLKHYGNCRCRPGPPHANAALVDPSAVPATDVAASREGNALTTIELAGNKPMAGGQELTKSGLVYDPASKSFRPATEADKQAAKDFNSKHPRAPKGTKGGTGGQFVPLGQARDNNAAAAQKDKVSVDAYNTIGQMTPDQQKAALRGLNSDQLGRLSRVAYSFKSSDPKLVALRIAVANELSGRGLKVTDFGALGGGGKAAPNVPGRGPARPKAAPSLTAGLPPAGRGGVLVGNASGAQIDALSKAGWKGDPNDNREAMYPPGTPPTKKAAGRFYARQTDAVELSAKTAGYSTSSTPLGTHGLWGHEGWDLPDYIRNVAKGIMESGKTKSKAIEIAIGKIRDWAEGKGDVSPEVRAASVKAIAEWEALRAKARATKLASEAEGVELSWREALHPRVKLGDHGGGRFTVKRGGLGRVPKGATRSYEGRGMTKIAAGAGGARKAAQVRAGTKHYVGTKHQITRSGLGGRTGKAEVGSNKYTPEQLRSAALDQAAMSGQPFDAKASHLARLMGLNLSADDLAKARKVFDKGTKKRGESAGSYALLAHLKELAAKRKAQPQGSASALRTGGGGTGKQTRVGPKAPRQLSSTEHTEQVIELAAALLAAAERVTRGKGRSSAAVELAAVNKHHVPGTAYHWWHNYRPRDVATALMWGKKAHAAKLHSSGSGHFNVEPSGWWKANPHLKKTLPANRKLLGGLTPVGKGAQPHAHALPKGATALAAKAHAAPDVKPFQKDKMSVQAAAFQKAVKTGTPQFAYKSGDHIVVTEKKPTAAGKVLEFKPNGQVDAHMGRGVIKPVEPKQMQDNLGPQFEVKAPRAPKPEVAKPVAKPAGPPVAPSYSLKAEHQALYRAPDIAPAKPGSVFAVQTGQAIGLQKAIKSGKVHYVSAATGEVSATALPGKHYLAQPDGSLKIDYGSGMVHTVPHIKAKAAAKTGLKSVAAPTPRAPKPDVAARLQAPIVDYAKMKDVPLNEPPLPKGKLSTGILVREPDGRIWIYEPKGHFGGYEHSFPKGKHEPHLTPQQNAHKELFEETGLTAKLTHYVGDYKGTTGVTRMYLAERVGGTPHKPDTTPFVEGGSETAAVKLVTPFEAASMLNTPRDKKILADAMAKLNPPKAGKGDRFTAIDTSGWKKVGGKQGSNEGGTYLAPDGSGHYVKVGKTPEHVSNELLATELYHLAGVNSADLRRATIDGKPGTTSAWIPSDKNFKAKLSDPAYKAKVQEGFATDAWLANWDVAGLEFDNVVTDKAGNPVRVDPGGALLYRAQGAPKGDKFGNVAGEWDTLRSGQQSGQVFGGMTDAQLKNSARKVMGVSPAQIDAAVDKAGFDPATAAMMKTRLKARRANIAARAGLSLPEAKVTAPNTSSAHIPSAAKPPRVQVVPTTVTGKRSKKGALVVQAPAGTHKTGDKIKVTSPKGNVHEVEITGVGKEFNVQGVPTQYHYVKSTPKSAAKQAEPKAAGGAPLYTGDHSTLTGAKVAATSQAFKTNQPAYLVPTGSGFRVSLTKPPDSVLHEIHRPDGTVGKHVPAAGPRLNQKQDAVLNAAKDVAKKLNKPMFMSDNGQLLAQHDGPVPGTIKVNPDGTYGPVRKAPKGLVNGSGVKPSPAHVGMIADTAQNTGKPVYLVEDPSTPSGFRMVYAKPADRTPHLAASPQGHVSEVASDGTSTMIKQAPRAKTPAVHTSNAPGLARLKAMPDIVVDPQDGVTSHIAAMQKAVKTGKTHYVVGPSTSAMVTDQKPIAGFYRRYEPNGDVYKGNASLGSPEQKLHPMAADYAKLAKAEHLTAPVTPTVQPISDTPFASQAEAEKSAMWLAKHGGGKAYWVATGPNGEIYNYNRDPHLPGAKKFVPPSKEPALTSAEASSVISAKAAANYFQKPAYISADGQLLNEPNGPIAATVQVDPDGTITKVGYPSGPIDSIEKLKAAAIHGKTFPADTNAEKQATAFQKAVNTGQTQYYGNATGAAITEFKPIGSYGEFKPDGTVWKHEPGGAVTQLSESQVIKVIGQFVAPKGGMSSDEKHTAGIVPKTVPKTAAKAPAKPKLKNPPTKAATGLGPTNKALYNAPDIQNNGNINMAKAAAVQQAIKTGQPKFLNTYGGKNEITDYPPDTSAYISFSPDGSAVQNTYGTKYPMKPSQVKASALIGLKTVGSEPVSTPKTSTPNVDTGSVDTGSVTTKPIKPEQVAAFQGTTAGDFLAGHGKIIGETAAGNDFKKKANITAAEHSAVYEYTGHVATELNRHLRKDKPLTSHEQNLVNGIDGAMAKYTTPGAIVVKRGMGGDGFPVENLAGQVYQDAGYGSTSFGQGFTGGSQITWNIAIPKGSHGVPIAGIGGGQHSHEKEFLLPRGTQYLIEKDETINGSRQITASVIPTPVHSPTKVTPAVKKHGVVHRAREKLAPGAYSKDGLLYLHQHGRLEWLRRYARAGTLAGAGAG